MAVLRYYRHSKNWRSLHLIRLMGVLAEDRLIVVSDVAGSKLDAGAVAMRTADK